MTSDTIQNPLLRRRFQRLLVTPSQCLKRAAVERSVASVICSVKRTLMMILPANVVEVIDHVHADMVSSAEMRRAMGSFLVFLEHVEGTVGLIAGISFFEGVSASTASSCRSECLLAVWIVGLRTAH